MNRPEAIVIVPAHHTIEPECDESLRKLEKQGYFVWRSFGHSAIDLARNTLAQQALDQGYKEIIWIDSDIVFTPVDVERLRNQDQPFVAGLYPGKNVGGKLCGKLLAENRPSKDGVVELEQVGFGFVYTRAEVYQNIISKLGLPVCSSRGTPRLHPWFMPMVENNCYYPEDAAFCLRARKAGYRLLGLTDVKVQHVGRQVFSLNTTTLPKAEVTYPSDIVYLDDSSSLNSLQKQHDELTAEIMNQDYRKVWTNITEFSNSDLAGSCSPITKSFCLNPSLLEYNDETWLFYRHDTCINLAGKGQWAKRLPIHIRAVKLNSDFEPLKATDHYIDIKSDRGGLSFEDPRVIAIGDDIWMTMVETDWKYSVEGWSAAGVKLVKMKQYEGQFAVKYCFFPKIGNNPTLEKNWSPFEHKGKLLVNYMIDPHIVINPLHPEERYDSKGIAWNFGQLHGGTPPTLIGNEYFSFFHCRFRHPQVKQSDGLSYCIGAYAFESEPPFKITRYTPYPILWADHVNNPVYTAAAVFPGGALFNKKTNHWLVSYGNNDSTCRLLTVPHDALIDVMKETV